MACLVERTVLQSPYQTTMEGRRPSSSSFQFPPIACPDRRASTGRGMVNLETRDGGAWEIWIWRDRTA